MIEKTVFGHLPSGEQVDLYTITNSRGASVSLQTLGAGIVRLYMPDKNGNLGDVVLGFDDPALYTDPDWATRDWWWVAGPTVFAAPPLTFRAKPTTPP